MRTSARIYVAAILALGGGVLAATWSTASHHGLGLAPSAVGFWLFFSLAAECFWLETPTRAGMVSMSPAANVASVFLLPTPLVLAVGAFSVGLSDLLLHRRGPLKAAFNAAQMVLSLGATLAVVHLLAGQVPVHGSLLIFERPLAVLAAPVVFFLANTLLVSGVLGLVHGCSLWRAWRDNYGFGYQILSSSTLSLVGLLLVVSFDTLGYIAGVFFLLLFFFIRDSYHRYVRDRARRLHAA